MTFPCSLIVSCKFMVFIFCVKSTSVCKYLNYFKKLIKFFILITICSMDKDGGQNTSNQRKRPQTGCRLSREFDAEWAYYTKHHLKFGKNQADNLAYIGFRRRFFPVFYWCLVLQPPYFIHRLNGYQYYSKSSNEAATESFSAAHNSKPPSKK